MFRIDIFEELKLLFWKQKVNLLLVHQYLQCHIIYGKAPGSDSENSACTKKMEIAECDSSVTWQRALIYLWVPIHWLHLER